MNIKNYWNWILGKQNAFLPQVGSWLSFNTTNPTVPTLITSPSVPINSSNECSVSISDDNGDVLFYSNGTLIYDSTNILLPVNFIAGSNTLQGVVGIQNPYNSNEYYTFNVLNWIDSDNCGGTSWTFAPNDLRWSKLTFSGQMYVSSSMNNILAPAIANSGVGGFCHTGKGYAEVITLMPHANGTDFWVITKPTGTVAGGPAPWEVFLVDAGGPNTTPVTSPSSFVFDGKNRRGGLKTNIAQNKVLFALGDDDQGNRQEAVVVLADFNNTTGQISSENILMKTNYTYSVFDTISGGFTNISTNTAIVITGCEFSPNSAYVYILFKLGILQIDLNNIGSWPASVVPNTTVIIPQVNALFIPTADDAQGLQIATDRKIYYNTRFPSSYTVQINTPDLAFNDPGYSQNNISYSVYGPNHSAAVGLPVVYIGSLINYLLTPCAGELPTIIVNPIQLTLPVNSGDTICVISQEGDNICYTVSETEDPVTTYSSIFVNEIFEDCEQCTEVCTTPINNVKLISCDGTQPNIIVPASKYNYNITPSTDTICLNIDEYQKACYRVVITQEPATSQETITPNAFYNNCQPCITNCYYKFYNLQDCYTGEVYLDSNDQPIQYFYEGSTSTFVNGLGGIDFLTSVVLTNIYNLSKVETAKGCFKLVEVTYVEGQSYTDIITGIDVVFYTDTCLQCKQKSCGDCDTLYTEKVNCKYADQVYAVLLSKKYGLETCCTEDLQKWDIKKELVDLTNKKDTYIPCCEACSSNCSSSTCNSNCSCNK